MYTPLAARFPFVDQDENTGFIIVFAFQAFILAIAAVGLAFSDLLFTILTFNIMTFSGLIFNQSKQLNEMLLYQKHNTGSVQFKFRNIILMHQEMNA